MPRHATIKPGLSILLNGKSFNFISNFRNRQFHPYFVVSKFRVNYGQSILKIAGNKAFWSYEKTIFCDIRENLQVADRRRP